MTVNVVSVNLLNEQNFPGQGNLPIIGDTVVGDFDILSVWGNVDFSFELSVSLFDDFLSLPVEVTGIEAVDMPDFLVSSSTENRIKISRKHNMFDEKYFYVKFDEIDSGEIVEIGPDDSTEEMSIVEWKPPSVKIIPYEIMLKVSYGVGSSILVPVNQSSYWNMDISLGVYVKEVIKSRW